MDALLKQDLSFDTEHNLTVMIPKGTKILVDPEECVGFYNGFHFHVDSDEYLFLHIF
jgi:hypothetical protein